MIPFLREIAIFSSNSQLLAIFRHCNSQRKTSVCTCKDVSLLREVRGRNLVEVFGKFWRNGLPQFQGQV